MISHLFVGAPRKIGLAKKAQIAAAADLSRRLLDMLKRLAQAEAAPVTQQLDGRHGVTHAVFPSLQREFIHHIGHCIFSAFQLATTRVD